MLMASLAALVVGPLLYPIFQTRRYLYRLLDGFIVIVIGGIVLFEVLPGVLAHHMIAGLILLFLGMMGPTILEKLFHNVAGQVHRAAVVIGIIGLIGHAFVDGIVLSELPLVGESGQGLLGIGVILHRLPVGFTIWWLLRPKYSQTTAYAVLGLMMLGTLGGYSVGFEAEHLASGTAALLFQAFAAGTILHVVIHRPHEPELPLGPAPAGWLSRWAEGIGNLIGLVVLLAIIMLHPEHDDGHGHGGLEETWELFWGLALESAPALLLAYFVGGLVSTLMPSASIRWMQRGSSVSRSVKGVVVGLPLPICTCGVLPLYQSLIKRGAPPTAAMAFLIATPELGLDALLISIPLLGGDMTVVRLVAAGVIALSVGWVVGRWAERIGKVRTEAQEFATHQKATLRERFTRGLKEGFGGLVDDTAPWILFGLAIAALAQPVLDQEWLQSLSPSVEVILFALLGLPIYVCASGATPIVAVMLISGISPGAALAFLLTGPATNVSTYGILSQVHDRRTALFFGIMTAGMAVLLGYSVNLLAPQLTLLTAADLELDESGIFQQICLVVLFLVFMASLLRRGARAFVGEVLSSFKPAHHHDHDHEHAAV